MTPLKISKTIFFSAFPFLPCCSISSPSKREHLRMVVRDVVALKARGVTLAFALLALSCFARASSAPATRDPSALSVVQQSLSAMGGVAAFAAIQDISVQGECAVTDTDAKGSTNWSTKIAWTVGAREFRYENTTDGETSLFVSGHGKPAASSAGSTQAVSRRTSQFTLAYHLPGLLLYRELSNPLYGMVSKGKQNIPEGPAIVVRLAIMAAGRPVRQTVQDWYFSPSTFLPMKVEYRIPSESASEFSVRKSAQYAEFQRQGEAAFPYQIALTTESFSSSQCVLSLVQVNTNPPDALFDAAAGGAQ